METIDNIENKRMVATLRKLNAAQYGVTRRQLSRALGIFLDAQSLATAFIAGKWAARRAEATWDGSINNLGMPGWLKEQEFLEQERVTCAVYGLKF